MDGKTDRQTDAGRRGTGTEKIQITNIRNEKGDITLDPAGIKRIRDHNNHKKKLYALDSFEVGETDQLLIKNCQNSLKMKKIK